MSQADDLPAGMTDWLHERDITLVTREWMNRAEAAEDELRGLRDIKRRAEALKKAGREDGAAGPYRLAARYILGETAQGDPTLFPGGVP